MSTIFQGLQPILDALIAGLGVANRDLDAHCVAALNAMGGRIVPYLRAAASDASPRRRNCIQQLASIIGEYQDCSCDVQHLTLEALVLAAAVQNDQDNPMLIPALKLLGPPAVDTLIKDAILNRNKPAVCLRILKAVEQLGDPSTVLGQLEVSTLYRSKYPAVRELAFRLFRSKRPSPRPLEAGVSA